MLTVNIISKSINEALSLTRAAIEQENDGVRLLSDSPDTALNIKKFLETQNYEVMFEDDNGKIILTATFRTSPQPSQNEFKPIINTPAQPIIKPVQRLSPIDFKTAFGILITGKNFSRESRQYGRVFLKRVIESLNSLKKIPDVIALMNEGVKLALYNSASCDFLKELEQKGCRVMISGMCADNFGLTESIGAGVISNIADIIEAVSSCDKVISL